MTHGLPVPRRYVAAFAVSIGSALLIIDGMIATVALPTIAQDLKVQPSAAILIITVYQLIVMMTLLPLATLGDRIGHRRLYQIGQVIFASGTMLYFFANSLPYLLIIRAVQAIGASAALSVSSALVRSIYPADQLGKGMGINTVIIASAAALAPTLGGFILSVASWPWVFAMCVPLVTISLLLGRTLPESEPRDEPFDYLGAALCAATFGLAIFGLESAVHGDSPVISAVIGVGGLVVGYFFVRRELRAARPMLPVDLLARPVFALSTIGAFAAFVASMMTVLSMPFRLQQTYGFGPGEVGAMIAPWSMTSVIVAPASGMLSDRIPAGILGAIGMALSALSLILIAFLPDNPSYFDIAWRMSICGAGFGMFLSPNTRLIIGSCPPERTAAAGGLVATTRMVGQTLGATLLAALLTAGLGGGPIPALIAAVLAGIAGFCSAARLRPSIRNPETTEMEDVSSVPPIR